MGEWFGLWWSDDDPIGFLISTSPLQRDCEISSQYSIMSLCNYSMSLLIYYNYNWHSYNTIHTSYMTIRMVSLSKYKPVQVKQPGPDMFNPCRMWGLNHLNENVSISCPGAGKLSNNTQASQGYTKSIQIPCYSSTMINAPSSVLQLFRALI